MHTSSAGFSYRLRLALQALLIVVLSGPAFGYTSQWQWQVSGDTQFFDNKPAAMGRMYTLYPHLSDQVVEKLESFNSETVSYQYRKPPQGPNFAAWVYGVNDPTGVPYDSEGAALEARRAKLAQSVPQCPSPVVTFSGAWVTTNFVVNSNYPNGARRNIQISNIYSYSSGPSGSQCTPSSTTWTEPMTRVRSWSCPSGYSFVWEPVPCRSTLAAASITGHPLPCPECDGAGVSDSVGNPIEVGTANKRQSETDYRGAGLAFTRTYNSQTLESLQGLGVGWSHNYGAKIIMPDGTTPAGLLRGDGHHDILRYVASNHYYSEVGTGLQLQKVGVEWIAYLDTGAREVYDSSGKLIRLIDPSGSITTINYGNDGIASVVGPFGHSLQFVGVGGRIDQIVDPAGQPIQFTYVGDNLTQVSYPGGGSRVYHYENSSFPKYLTGITDEVSARFATFGYDSSGRATLTEHGGGVQRYTLNYLTSTTVVTEPSGASTTYSFTPGNRFRKIVGRLTAGLNSTATVPTYETDFQRRATQRADARGLITQFTYDLNHRTSKTEAFGTASARTTSYLYRSANEDLPTQIDEPGRRTTITYDANANVLTRTVLDTANSVSRTWTYTYNSFGRILTADGPRTDVSDITTYAYYTCTTGAQCGQLYTITNALGHTTTYNSYNAHAQPTQITDANGLVTSLAYDPRQRLVDRCVGSTLPACAGGELTHLDYWPTGLLKKVTNPDASYMEYTYDAAHRLTQINDGALNKIVYTLDNAGNRTAENTYDPGNALRRTHTRIFNTLNQLWKDVNAAGNANVTTTFGYDNDGNQISVSAPLSRNSTSLYDELNRLKQITDPASGITQFGYDANDNLTSVTDPRSLVTSYSYNGFGDLKTQTSPDTGLTTNTYDSSGNLDTSTDSRGAVTDYDYDVANRVTSASFTLSGVTDQTITYGYDVGTNQKGRLTSATDANHTLAWTYDARGRITGKGQTVGGTTLAMGYGYNSAGQLGNMQLPSGANVVFGYNANGQVTSLTLNGATLLSSITYDPFGPITSWTWGNGTSANRAFDTDGKIRQVDNANGASLETFAYDDAFRITGIAEAADPMLSWTYGYDSLDRLNSATKTGTTQGWTYDANGNRLTQTGSAPSTYTNSMTSNRVSSISGSLPRTYTYDTAGNTLSYAGATFTYNNRGRMATATNGGVTATYTYNALGQRIRRTASGITTLYVYDEAGHLSGEYTSGGALIQETVWLGDIPVATLRPNGLGGVTTYYVHADHLNTPRLVTDTSNNIRWKWESDPFGSTIPNENPSVLGLFAYNLRFPGQQYDAVVGLHYNYFRDYDPAVGRYVESDPIGLMGGLNTYLYASATPSSLSDPSGMNPATGAVWGGNAGTAIGGALGGPPGALAGRLIGSGIGAGLGFLILACTDNYEEKCNERFAKEEARCNRFRGRGPKEDPDRWYRACVTRAADRRNLCYSNKGPSDDEPGEYGDRDIP
jgi:RHS repeat-associated protein